MEQLRDYKGRYSTFKCDGVHHFCAHTFDCPWCVISNNALEKELRGFGNA